MQLQLSSFEPSVLDLKYCSKQTVSEQLKDWEKAPFSWNSQCVSYKKMRQHPFKWVLLKDV